MIYSTFRIASIYPPQWASVWSWEGSSPVRSMLLGHSFTNALCFISKNMTVIPHSSILPAWCGLSKAVFQEFKMVASAGRGTDNSAMEEFSQNPFCSSKCNFSKMIFLAGSKNYVIVLAFHLFVHLFVP